MGKSSLSHLIRKSSSTLTVELLDETFTGEPVDDGIVRYRF
jgi:hypothetical protein